MAVDYLTVSSKGQVVIPARWRKELSIESGDRLAACARDGIIVLVPVRAPSEDELEAWLDEARDWAEREGLEPSDVDAAIAEARGKAS